MKTPWRLGSHYKVHVYADDVPVATFFTTADAQLAIAAVNMLSDEQATVNKIQYVMAQHELYGGGWYCTCYPKNADGSREPLTETSDEHLARKIYEALSEGHV